MSCYHPIKGFIIGQTINNKKELIITSYDIDHIELLTNGKYRQCVDPHRSPHAERVFREFIEIPCGRCIGCRLAYSRQWADRCMCEKENHDESWFVTLTYSPENMPYSEYIDNDGVITDVGTLVKRDFQLFMKRLRKNTGQKVRYFAAGEYGSETARPHYHAIIFGLHLDDLTVYKRNFQGDIYYNSETLSKIWNQGHVVIAEVTWESCAYVARYIMKKQLGKSSDVYELLNIEPEFTVMSRKPGIGLEYFEKHKQEFLDYKESNLATSNGGRKIKNIKYFDKKLELEFPVWYNNYQEDKKKAAEAIKAYKLSQTDLDYQSLLEVEERQLKGKSKALLRKEI